MVEPLSVTTGVIGLIKTSYEIIKLIDSMKNAPSQAAAAATEITETRTILEQLQNFLLRFETADKSRTAQVQVDQLVDIVSGCMATFSEFEAALDKTAGSSMTRVGRAKWVVWDEEKIASLIARLQRHKSSLSLMVTILTGETQIRILDSLERLNVAVDMSHEDTLRRSPPADNESVISRKTSDSQAGMSSDSSSIITVIHTPRDLNPIPYKQYHYDFEPDLEKSRPYRKMSLVPGTSTISLTETNMKGWSILSGFSLADISNISVLSLTISLSELYNPDHYQVPEGSLSAVRSKRPEGEVLQQQARQGKEKGSALKHTWSVGMANFRASLYMSQGRMAKAENMYRHVLEVNERMLGPEHMSTLETIHHLGIVYDAQDKLAEAEATFQRALAGREKVLGPEHESTLNTVHALGNVYNDRDKLVEAEAMLQRALAGLEKVLGPDGESTLNTVHTLGVVYDKRDKLVEAEATLRRALAGREEILGPSYESTLNTVHALGVVYDKRHKLVEAEGMFQRALAGRERVLGPVHKSTLKTIHHLGHVYNKRDKLVEAEAMFQRALAGREKVLGPEHESTLKTIHHLGHVYDKKDKLVEAEAMFRQALAGMENVLGPEHELTLDTVYALGVVYDKRDKLVEAEAMFQRALAGREKVLGLEHESTLDTVHDLGLVYYKGDKLVEAEGMFQRALAGREKVLGLEHESTLGTIHNLGRVYRKQGRTVEAEALQRRIQRPWEIDAD